MQAMNKLFKSLCKIMVIFLAVCILNGLTSAQQNPKEFTIAVIPKGATHTFWKSIHAGALMAAHELGNVNVIWKSGLKEDDRDSQIKVLEDMITLKVDGIVLAPLDDVALRPYVNEATINNIPVVIIDSDLKSDKYISFIATDNYLGGRKAADLLAKMIGEKGRVIMLRYAEGSASTMQRERGFLDAIRKYTNIVLVSTNQFGGATAETAYKASENLIAPLKTADGRLSVDGIFCCNESTTFGMLRALQDSKLAGKVKFVGFDSSRMLVNALENGEIHGLILQDPFKMGYLGVKTIYAFLNGQKVQKRIDTGAFVVTKENMNDPELQKLLYPDIKKWLKE
jgi:ribose transport system substrate-binding protein